MRFSKTIGAILVAISILGASRSARLNALSTGRVHGSMVTGAQYLTAAKMGFR